MYECNYITSASLCLINIIARLVAVRQLVSLCFPFFFCPMLSNSENSSSDQRQACKKHELYVSFRDLGWQVILLLYLELEIHGAL